MSLPLPCNIAQLCLFANVPVRSRAVALQTPQGQVTYRELADETIRVAHALRDLGVSVHNRVVIALPDGVPLAATFLAVTAIGAIAVVIPPESSSLAVAKQAGARLIIDAAARNDLCVAYQDLPILLTPRHGQFELYPTTEEYGALWHFPLGTSEEPVRETHGSMMAMCKNLAHASALLVFGQFRSISVPRLFVVNVLVVHVLAPLEVGGWAVLGLGLPTAETVFMGVATYQSTALVNTPAMVAEMLEWVEVHPEARLALAPLRIMIVMDAKDLSVELYNRWVKLFPTILVLDACGSVLYPADTRTFYVRGRLVSPVAIENSLLDCPGVTECAVVDVYTESGLATTVAFVRYTPGRGVPLPLELQHHVIRKLGRHMSPATFSISAEPLPHTESGEIDYAALRVRA